jgi:hypothetical protein
MLRANTHLPEYIHTGIRVKYDDLDDQNLTGLYYPPRDRSATADIPARRASW